MTASKHDCPFCQIHEANILHRNDFAFIMYDAHPVSRGHSLIIPHRHISSFFEVSDKERKSLVSLLEIARNELKMIYQPDGFHVGFNEGNITGQRIDHLHIHLIPRYVEQPLSLDVRWGVVSTS